jgi:hypothetical protein
MTMNHAKIKINKYSGSYLISSWHCPPAIALGLLLFFATPLCHSQASAGASPPPIKVVSASQVLIKLDAPGANYPPVTAAVVEDLTPCLLPDPKGPKYACSAAESNGQQPVYRSAKLAHPASANENGVYVLEFASDILAAGRLYRLTLEQTDPASQAMTTASFSVDTSPSIVVALVDLGSSRTRLFRLTSTLGFVEEFATGGGVQKGETVAEPVDCVKAGSKPGAAPIKIIGISDGAKATVSGWKMPLEPLSGSIKAANPVQLGAIALCLNLPSSRTGFTPDGSLIANAMGGIESALGAVTWAVAPETKLAASGGSGGAGGAGGGGSGGGAAAMPTTGQPSPAAKSAANFYADVNLAAATGASFAWGLDGKLSEYTRPILKGSPAYITWLSATADTGHNTSNVKGQVYTDTIDWTLPLSYPFTHASGPRFEAIASLAPDYETDIEFDRKNMLVAGDLVWNFATLYQPQNKRTPAQNGALVNYPNPALARFGYVLQFHTGFEAGGALIDTVQKASSGIAKITVPAYSIARAVPQITGNIQWIPARRLGLLTFDDTIAGRYLFDTENIVKQYPIPAAGTKPATVGLRLLPLDGWKAYNCLVSTWNPPQTANFGVTVTYDDGFNAPKFTRVNSVTVGVTIAY